jgi:hypothetical protein
MVDPSQNKNDRVTLVVALTLAGLTLGGIFAIFASPLRALLTR